jgi:hypothetical protein
MLLSLRTHSLPVAEALKPLTLYAPECVEEFSEVGMQDAAWPRSLAPYGRPESSRLLKVDHYILDARITMRLGGCVASSQNDDADTGGGVVRSFDPGSVTRGTACLTSVCIQADLKAVEYGQAGRVLETTSFGYRAV